MSNSGLLRNSENGQKYTINLGGIDMHAKLIKKQ